MTAQSHRISPRLVVQLLVIIVLVPMLPLLITGRWDWLEAWLFALAYILGFVVSRVLVARVNPDLIAERARMMNHEDTEAWDRLLAPLVALGAGFIPLVAGLDARFGWSPLSVFSVPVKVAALIIILGGLVLGSYALLENRFFSGVVRIQTDRGQHVVSSGPYRWIRHPGYTGALLTYLAAPFLLDSLWAFVPALLLTVALVIRTWLEDQTLRHKLNGYHDYASRVRFRLLPGVW
ncbi:MAG: isoprenylcysteine carboxylmethyltransferase family protein [Anaerolineae bacterium]|nr:isoprenylcysteine carboxylmethyltransferase family protein [Anaerolineae bacterium]